MAGDDTITLISDARKAGGDGNPESFESSAWARLAHASDAHHFAGSWLDIQCRALDGVIRAASFLAVGALMVAAAVLARRLGRPTQEDV